MGWNEFMLKLLPILLTWQVIGGIILLIFGIYFRKEIKIFLSSICKIKINSNEIILQHEDPTKQGVNEPKKETDNKDMTKLIQNDPDRFLKEYNSLVEKFSFENIFNNIYGSQIRFLIMLNTYPDVGLNYSQAEQFYMQFYNSLAPMFRSVANKDIYFNWLQQVKLIKDDGNKFFITDYGKRFLDYAQKTNLLRLYRAN